MEEPSGAEQAGPARPEAESRMAVEEAAAVAAEAAGEEEREARLESEPEPEPEDNQLTEAALPPAPAAGSTQESSEALNSGEPCSASLLAASQPPLQASVFARPSLTSPLNSALIPLFPLFFCFGSGTFCRLV